jgi:hypothetical protein
MKKFGLVLIAVFLMLGMSSCKSADERAIEAGYVKPVSNEGLVVIIDGYGSQGTYGDTLNGRKIVVRDDLEPNENGWFTREVYKVNTLEDLGISNKFVVEFPVEYERDYSEKNKAFVGYFSMNIANNVAQKDIQKFLDSNPDVVATSVVNRIDGEGNFQECSLKGLQPDAIRFILYSGEGISYQICTADLKTP